MPGRTTYSQQQEAGILSNRAWMPPRGSDVVKMPLGDLWSAVSLPARHSARVNSLWPSGPHILNEAAGLATWLIPPSDAQQQWYWRRIERYLDFSSEGSVLLLPQADRRAVHGDVHWALPEKWAGTYVGEPCEIAGVLAVVTLEYGPPAYRCEMCPDPVWPEAQVTAAIPASQGGPCTAVMHRACARTYGFRVLEQH